MDNFFITGLPRSRTAWMANWLTYGHSFCFHEALKFSTPKEWKALFLGKGEFVGNSDSGIPFFMDDFYAAFPKSPVIIIERDPSACVMGLNKLFPNVNNVLLVTRTLERLAEMKKRKAFVFKFDDLNDISACKDIWDICLPGVEFNEERWKMLDKLTVEISMPKYPKILPKEVITKIALGMS